MNEYNLNIDFCKGRISTNLRRLVQNDYNTTKLNFTFDKEGRVLFKMLYPDGTQYVDEIQNNELIFGEGVLNQEGTYEYEISLYTEDGRLTDYAVKSFEVRSELVDTDEIVEPDDRVPVLDNLINEVTAIKTSAENGEFNGEDGITPTIGKNGNWFIDGVDTGLPSRGETGETGGVSLEEVTAITGSLENLNTEDKSNLVGAINEVLNNSGGGSGITELTGDIVMNDLASGLYLLNDNYTLYYRGTSQADKFSSPSTGYKRLLFIGKNFYSGGSYSYGYLFDTNDVIKYRCDMCTKTKLTFSNIITSNNTTSYTPTSDYNPATKIYVDTAIANAITTSLEASY